MTSNTDQSASARVHAIIPAAGRSRRMGKSKQLLEVGGQTMLESVIEPLAASGELESILLVTHDTIAQSIDLSKAPNIRLVLNEDESSEMIDSIRMGLNALGLGEQHNAGSHLESFEPQEGILVVPGDQPGLSATDIQICVQAYRRNPHAIVIGTWQGRRGHPIVFPAALAPFVMSAACDSGLRELPRRHPDRVLAVECGSEAAVRNVNTPSDYRDLKSRDSE